MGKTCYGCMKEKTSSPVCEHCGFDERQRNERHQLPIGIVLRQQYVVGRVLGQGGFGITYIGWDMNLDMPVAIKEFYPGNLVSRDCTMQTEVRCYTNARSAYEDSKARFLREAKALAKFMDVPEIVRVQSFFEENGTAYIVMEYVQGTDLRNYLRSREGSPSAGEILEMVRPLMQALTVVHEAGLVHRDISPDNIMLLPSGQVKLLDFGAVREVEHAGVDRELTRSTQAILKHGFAPLEQYQAKGALGPWTDVYALCATLYYCMTGRVPPEAHDRMLDNAQLEWDRIEGLTKRQIETLEKGMALLPKDRLTSVRELYEGIFEEKKPDTEKNAVEAEKKFQNDPVPKPEVKSDSKQEARQEEPRKEPEKEQEKAGGFLRKIPAELLAVVLAAVAYGCRTYCIDLQFQWEYMELVGAILAYGLVFFWITSVLVPLSRFLLRKKLKPGRKLWISDVIVLIGFLVWCVNGVPTYYGRFVYQDVQQSSFFLLTVNLCMLALTMLNGEAETVCRRRKIYGILAGMTIIHFAILYAQINKEIKYIYDSPSPWYPIVLGLSAFFLVLYMLREYGTLPENKAVSVLMKAYPWILMIISILSAVVIGNMVPFYSLV